MMDVHNPKPYEINHERREEIVKFIEAYVVANCRPPSLRDICKGTSVKSPSHMLHYMRELVKAGELTSTGGVGARRYVPTWVPKALADAHKNRANGHSYRGDLVKTHA